MKGQLTAGLRQARNGDRVFMAGLVLVRQRPGTASGVVFVISEDEFGIANSLSWIMAGCTKPSLHL